MRLYKNCGFSTITMGMLMVFLFNGLSTWANDGGGPQANMAKAANKLLIQSLKAGDITHTATRLAQAQEKRLATIKARLEQHKLHQILQEKINEAITPGEKMKFFFQQLAKLKTEGKSKKEIKDFLTVAMSGSGSSGTGSISGTVTVAGVPTEGVIVLAFDEYGYPAGEACPNPATGEYTIQGLWPGKYFVATESPYVNEFYDNIPLDFFANWRLVVAGNYLVQVAEGMITPNINFDLQTGATVTGTIYEEDGVTPITNTGVYFELTTASSPTIIMVFFVETGLFGEYTILIPSIGNVKLYARAEGYQGEYYQNKNSWAEADPITISSLEDTVTGIDFSLRPAELPEVPSGAISGTIKSPTGIMPVPLGFAVAFNMADTSVAGFGFSILGSYIIPALAPGKYLVYADDIAGNLLGVGNYVGEYYKDAPTPGQATLVNVAQNDTTEGIDFKLDIGGSITGRVLGPNSTPLDSIIIVAFNADLIASGLDPFLANLGFDLTFTDTTGKYTLSGLPTGQYILRTITLPHLDLEFFELSGEHFGKVLDEYYENVHSLWDIRKATPVAVTAPRVTSGINFTLEGAGSIAGKVTAADGTTPVPDVLILTLNATSGIPELVFPVTDEQGQYVIRPLDTGDYKLLAISNPEDEPDYLPEFYDGAHDFEAATTVHVTAPNLTPDKNFTLELGGRIQGFVNLSSGFPAGADTLWEFPVVAYDATTGKARGFALVSFSGGYRISRLPAGSYKVAALPVFWGYAATYYGGGKTFDDPASALVTITAGNSNTANITLEQAAGTISGFVKDEQTGEPLLSLVLAYDQTGHAVSAGASEMDLLTGMPTGNNGAYTISGLRTGSYYVRTWSIFSLLMHLEEFDLENGLLGLGTLPTEIKIPGDEWYNDIPISLSDLDPF
ncbi:MAG: carboxypeptidase-like regulatory domain-containing protein, partial [candidate division KSB1 bacterium]|nr:carboxypeptidase-like regulatory domain-containing protein [candidate division KSB1 bacterium]